MSDWRVPLTDIAMPEQDVQAVLDCLRSGWLTMGPRTQAFEQALARYVGAPHAVAVSSGTAALHLACLAAEIGPGDEVIVPALTFVASANAARYAGAEPVLCDIRGRDPHGRYDLNIDVEDVARRITPHTRAVVAVHFCGYPADVLALRQLCDERGLVLIEDCAQAIGAHLDDTGRQVGTVGELGAFSFFSKKQLCVGEGGMVSTADEELLTRVRLLRSHALTSSTWDRHRGHDPAYDVVDIGFNFRLDEPRAALGLSRLARLDADLAARRAVVRAYRERLIDVPGLELAWDEPAIARSSHFVFPVLLADRDARDRFRVQLKARGVQTTWYPALHTFSEYRPTVRPDDLPRATEASDRHCALPLSATMDEASVEIVVDAIRAALSSAPSPTVAAVTEARSSSSEAQSSWSEARSSSLEAGSSWSGARSSSSEGRQPTPSEAKSSSSQAGVDIERAQREREAYDEHGVDEVLTTWHGRFPHVFQSPNTRRAEERFNALTRAAVAGRRVLDMGCGKGASSVRLLDLGAAHVLGVDISETSIAQALAREQAQVHLRAGRLEFRLGDVTHGLQGEFDCVFGRSILHHIAYRGVLPRLYAEHLAPGGRMLFMEPQGENLLIRLYTRLIAAAHTPDERSFMEDDLRWLREHFPTIELHPVNYLTFPAAILTSYLPIPPDNPLLRACDRADEWLARRAPRLRSHFRQTIVAIRKPAA